MRKNDCSLLAARCAFNTMIINTYLDPEEYMHMYTDWEKGVHFMKDIQTRRYEKLSIMDAQDKDDWDATKSIIRENTTIPVTIRTTTGRSSFLLRAHHSP